MSAFACILLRRPAYHGGVVCRPSEAVTPTVALFMQAFALRDLSLGAISAEEPVSWTLFCGEVTVDVA